MFEAEDITLWRDRDIVDAHGGKVGSIESIYYDTATQQPTFACVQVGIVGRRHLTFVPLQGATVAPQHVRVPIDKKLIKSAPSIDTDGELTAEEEPAIFEHYGIPYSAGATGERRLGRR